MSANRKPVLRLLEISKSFGPVLANDKISFDVHPGETLALLGENGAGKTTLMNILFGHYLADHGHIEVFGRALPPGSPKAALMAGIGMVHQHFTLADNLSALDNIMVGAESLWRWRSDRIVARNRLLTLAKRFHLTIDPDAPVSSLSVGERQRVEILKALYRDAKILILDEPTAVLTPQEASSLFTTLKSLTGNGLAVIFISHKMHEVLTASDTIVVLRGGRRVMSCKTSDSNARDLAKAMVGRPIVMPSSNPMPAGAPILQLSGITVASDRGRPLLDAVDLTVRRHQIVGIAGVAGNGQAALVDLISGSIQPDSGRLRLLESELSRLTPRAMIERGVARIPEDRHATGLIADMTLWENLIAERYREPIFNRWGIVRRAAARRYAQEIVERFDVRCPGLETRTALLSGGNMQKLILGRNLIHRPKLILASQPTRGLDIGAVSYVQEQLLAARADGAGVLLISEDLDELLSIADVLCVAYHGKLTPLLPRSAVTAQDLGLLMAGRWERLKELSHVV